MASNWSDLPYIFKTAVIKCISVSLATEMGTDHLNSDLMSHEPHSIITLKEAREPPAGRSYLGVLSVSVAGGNEAVLSCRAFLRFSSDRAVR